MDNSKTPIVTGWRVRSYLDKMNCGSVFADCPYCHREEFFDKVVRGTTEIIVQAECFEDKNYIIKINWTE